MSESPTSPSVATKPKIPLLSPLAIILVSRAGLMFLAYAGLTMFPGTHFTTSAMPGNAFLDGWLHWDAGWYAQIAREGYTNHPDEVSGQRDAAFLPMYPLTVRAVGKLVGDVYVAGFLVSNISFVIAGLILFRIAEKHWDEQIARRTLILLCVFPFSFIFSAMYTESVFLLLSLAAFWFAEKKWWHLAAICAPSGATRVVGIATAIAVAFMYFQSIEFKPRSARWDALWLLIGFLGCAAHPIYFAIRFHEPLALFNAYSAKGWGDWNNWQTLSKSLAIWKQSSFEDLSSGNFPLLLLLHFVLCIGAGIFCVISWKRLPLAYAIWTTIVVLISFRAWGSFGRYSVTAFPLFITAGLILKESRVYHGWIYLSTLLLALLTLMFTHGIWVA